MSHVRGRRALRFSVLAASVAVLASFVVAPAARAESTDVATTEAPSTESAPSTSEPEATTPPTETAPGTTDAPTTTPTDAPVVPGDVAPGDTVVGELVQAWPDPTAEDAHHEDGDHAGEAPLSWIEPVEGDAVRVPTEDIPAVAVGSTIAVTVGDEVTDEASAEQGFEPAVEVLDATVLDVAEPDPTTAETGTVPTNTVTAVLVVPAGASADGTTITSVVNQLNGPVSSFWNAQSDGTVRIAAVAGATGWLSSSQSCANPSGLWNDIAGQIGWTSGPGKHLMLYLPANATSCSYGLGTVGSSIGTGGRAYVRDVALSVMAHELGHNFGLGHSSEYQCNSALETGTCQTRDYYDFYDVMGISWGQVGSLNAAQAARLGLLPGSEQVALTPSSPATTVSLAPVSATSGVRAVKLTDGNGVVYYLEYRQASGQDAWLGDGRNAYGLNSGVVLRRAGSGSNTSLLLDGTPSPSSGWSSDMQQALPVGSPVSVAGGSFSVVALSVNPGGASIRIAGASGSAMSLPRGNLESVAVSGAVLTVTGWAFDPDQATTSSPVHVYVDGAVQIMAADLSRPDVAAAFPGAGSGHGFVATRQVSPGSHQVCAYAIDVDLPSRFTALGCRTVLTQVTPPRGNLEDVSAAGSTVTVSGWALDPDQLGTSSQVHVRVDGALRIVTADAVRTDIGSAFPGAGSAHGFSVHIPVAPGPHVVCVFAIDADIPSWFTSLGCRGATTQMARPIGNLDAVSAAGSTVSVTGWALDPDQQGTSSLVHVRVDGELRIVTADGSRPDVGAAFTGAGPAHGFIGAVQVAPGVHQVCAYAIDADVASWFTDLGCRSVRTQVTPPLGNWDTLSVSATAVTVEGWTLDPDAPTAPTQVHVYVDGSVHILTADGTRGDIGSAFPGAGSAHGFSLTATLAPGTHRVCAYAIDVDTTWRFTPLDCRAVVIG